MQHTGCASMPCRNGGTCVPAAMNGVTFVCRCLPLFAGADCSVPVPPVRAVLPAAVHPLSGHMTSCATKPCHHGVGSTKKWVKV